MNGIGSQRAPRAWQRLAAALGMVVGIVAAAPVAAPAGAIFSANIDAKLTVATAPIENQFGFATFPGTTQADVISIGNASGAAGATAPTIPKGIEGISIVSGKADPFGVVESVAETAGKINLGNLTGSGPPTPPGKPLTVMLNLSFSFSLSVKADTPCDEALAYIAFDVTSNGGSLFTSPPTSLFVIGPNMDSTSGSGSVNLPITLPANSVTPVYLRTEAFGFAFSDFCIPPMPPPPPPPPPPPLIPVPELGTASLAASALPFGLIVLRRRRGMAGGPTRPAEAPTRSDP